MSILLTALQIFTMALEVGYSEKNAQIISCIAKYESGFDQYAYNKNSNGSKDFGVLQINDKVWMFEGRPCFHLNPLNPYESLICAKKIIRMQGFEAWYGYIAHKEECDSTIYRTLKKGSKR